MKKTRQEITRENARAELYRMLRNYPGDRPPHLVTEMLERGESLKPLGRISTYESSMVTEYILGYVALGHPKTAARMIDDLGISMDWKMHSEFVWQGYSSIAAGIERMLRRSGRIDQDYFVRLESVQKLTGMQIHDEAHLTILKAMPEASGFALKKRYLLTVRRSPGIDDAEEIYKGKFYANSGTITDMIRFFKSTGSVPSAKVKKALLDYFENGTVSGSENHRRIFFPSFEKIEEYLVLFTGEAEGKEAMSRLPEGIASACFKLGRYEGNLELPVLTEKEINALLGRTFKLKNNIETYELDMRYLKEHKVDRLFDQGFLKAKFEKYGEISESEKDEEYRIKTALKLIRDRNFLLSILKTGLAVALKLNRKEYERSYRGVTEERLTELDEEDSE